MSRSADSDSRANDVFSSSKSSAVANGSPSERAFAWPVSDAIAEILERVEVADTNFAANAGCDGSMKVQDSGSGETGVRSRGHDPEGQATFDTTDTHVKRFVMDSASIGHPIRIPDSVRETINQDGALLLDIRQGLCFSMNPVGARIWEMLKSEHSLDQIASALVQEFQVPRAQIETDIAEFLDSLKRRNLIQKGSEQNPKRKAWLARFFA